MLHLHPHKRTTGVGVWIAGTRAQLDLVATAANQVLDQRWWLVQHTTKTAAPTAAPAAAVPIAAPTTLMVLVLPACLPPSAFAQWYNLDLLRRDGEANAVLQFNGCTPADIRMMRTAASAVDDALLRCGRRGSLVNTVASVADLTWLHGGKSSNRDGSDRDGKGDAYIAVLDTTLTVTVVAGDACMTAEAERYITISPALDPSLLAYSACATTARLLEEQLGLHFASWHHFYVVSPFMVNRWGQQTLRRFSRHSGGGRVGGRAYDADEPQLRIVRVQGLADVREILLTEDGDAGRSVGGVSGAAVPSPLHVQSIVT